MAACGSDDEGGGEAAQGEGAKIALLLPESKTTRYEQQDRPNFERRVYELCPDCEVIYSNADQDPAKQQQQAEQAITNGAKVDRHQRGRRQVGGRASPPAPSSPTSRSSATAA